MENQHRQITGYRELTQGEVDLMNKIKAKAEEVKELIAELNNGLLPSLAAGMQEVKVGDEAMLVSDSEDYETFRWLDIGQSHLQQGFMALTRAVARPTTF